MSKPIRTGYDALAYLESEARRIADMYSAGSDGRNTFVIFAEKIASTAAAFTPASRNDVLEEAALVAIHNSNFGHSEGNRRAFKIADEIRARMDETGDQS